MCQVRRDVFVELREWAVWRSRPRGCLRAIRGRARPEPGLLAVIARSTTTPRIPEELRMNYICEDAGIVLYRRGGRQ